MEIIVCPVCKGSLALTVSEKSTDEIMKEVESFISYLKSE